MVAHARITCPHGVVIAQCRCPQPNIEYQTALCPFPEHQSPDQGVPDPEEAP
jgi:hypothetical protein